jgi:hypothetical protein
MRKMCTLITSKGTDIDEHIANQNRATRTRTPKPGYLNLSYNGHITRAVLGDAKLRPRLHGTERIWDRSEIRPFSPVYTGIRGSQIHPVPWFSCLHGRISAR